MYVAWGSTNSHWIAIVGRNAPVRKKGEQKGEDVCDNVVELDSVD